MGRARSLPPPSQRTNRASIPNRGNMRVLMFHGMHRSRCRCLALCRSCSAASVGVMGSVMSGCHCFGWLDAEHVRTKFVASNSGIDRPLNLQALVSRNGAIALDPLIDLLWAD